MYSTSRVRVAVGLVVLLVGMAVAITAPAAVDPTQVQVSAKDVGADEIVYVKRKPYSSDHYYTDINNGTSGDRFLPENGIFVFNLQTRRERPVVTSADLPGGKGFIGYMSLSFDAKKVLFDFREISHGQQVLSPILKYRAVPSVSNQLVRVLGNLGIKVVSDHVHDGRSLGTLSGIILNGPRHHGIIGPESAHINSAIFPKLLREFIGQSRMPFLGKIPQCIMKG